VYKKHRATFDRVSSIAFDDREYSQLLREKDQHHKIIFFFVCDLIRIKAIIIKHKHQFLPLWLKKEQSCLFILDGEPGAAFHSSVNIHPCSLVRSLHPR